ncbi:MAG TPA: glycosyltransferase [Candidatus Acidoferrum sp.]|nr:glycosyltransferase [Candidatus Acidoferrum sp.]
MARPIVSVLIDTYNHERFIEQAVLSVLEQDFPASDREILVVDDGSQDRTPEIAARFAPQVRLLRKANGGQASAFNAGIPECQGEIVAFLDGDDWWVPGKLKLVVAAFSENPEVGMVGHGTTHVFTDGSQFTEVIEAAPRFSLASLDGAKLFLTRRSFLGTRMCVRTLILRKILPVPEMIRIEADEFVFTMAAALSDVLILPESLFFYRIHTQNHFSLHGFDPASVRRKQQSLDCLAEQLNIRLRAINSPDEVVRLIVEAISVEANQLRLSLGDGFPWETVKTELAFYRILHGDAPRSHRAFKYATLLPAFLLPPRWFYGARRWLGSSELYRRTRRIFFPPPQPGHVRRFWNANP